MLWQKLLMTATKTFEIQAKILETPEDDWKFTDNFKIAY